jgi:hypothetical protein
MYLANHGGLCCGIKHLYGFGACNAEYKRMVLSQLNNARNQNRGAAYNVLVEVALNEHQMEDGWHEWLTQEVGFVQATRFRNPNSHNFVGLYYYTHQMGEALKMKKEEEAKVKLVAEEAAREADRLIAEAEQEALAAAVMPTPTIATVAPAKPLLRRKKKVLGAAVKPLLKKRKKIE